jgi:EmrB/QacA subfamily drug resistance transporter
MTADIYNEQNGPAAGDNLKISKKQAYLIFAVVSLALVMSSIDSSIVSVGLHSMLNDLKTNLAYIGWTITGYQLSQSIMMPIMGKISDDWGRKRVFLIAVGIFTLSSLAAGFAPNVYLLIIFRVLQGIGGGAFMPSATGIISDAFGHKRSTAIGLFSSIFPIGSIIGPNVGGLIIDHLSWRWIFFINIPIGALLITCGLFILPRSRAMAATRSIDYGGAGLFSGAVLAILYSLTNWANHPESGVGVMAFVFLGVAAVLLVLFVRRESRVEQPIIELKLLRWRPFLAANIYNFVFGAVVFGIFSFIPYYATVAYGMTAGEAGLVLTPRSIAAMVLSIISSLFIIRFRYRLPMIIGSVVMACGFILLSRGYSNISIFGLTIQNLALLAFIVMLGGVGMGIANPASNNAILDIIPGKVASVAGLRGMLRITGGAFGTAVVALVLSRSQDKGAGFQQVSLFSALLLLLLIPVVFMIPDLVRKGRKDSETSIE